MRFWHSWNRHSTMTSDDIIRSSSWTPQCTNYLVAMILMQLLQLNLQIGHLVLSDNALVPISMCDEIEKNNHWTLNTFLGCENINGCYCFPLVLCELYYRCTFTRFSLISLRIGYERHNRHNVKKNENVRWLRATIKCSLNAEAF